ncbi:MAG: fluoride efflux transporter CrcB [Betaproteobacteria bacterium]|nr:fluoride efflux transporter CrcB [Betaproteobacteria bacterium]MDE2424006.1 fluoride efflux transporter CrcB [Betaproteobacteria bacterium]
MGLWAIVSVSIGAALGALLRWWLSLVLNPLLPTLPLGTLAANLIGGYLVGVAVAFFTERAGFPPELRLFIITGFMGGLTTFSTFSAEAIALLLRSEYVWASLHVFVHLVGSLVMTSLGIATVHFLEKVRAI